MRRAMRCGMALVKKGVFWYDCNEIVCPKCNGSGKYLKRKLVKTPLKEGEEIPILARRITRSVPLKERMLLIMEYKRTRDRLKLTERQVSNIMGLPVSVVSMVYHRARYGLGSIFITQDIWSVYTYRKFLYGVVCLLEYEKNQGIPTWVKLGNSSAGE